MSSCPDLSGSTLLKQIEALLVDLAVRLEPPPQIGPGRPPRLPAAILWASLAIAVLRGARHQSEVWRIATATDFWRGTSYAVSDEAVYQRLDTTGPSPMEMLFHQVTAALRVQLDPGPSPTLAPFATDVVAIDQTTLDPVIRALPQLRPVARGDHQLLPGKIAGVFDLRTQLWTTIQLIADPHQNEKVVARDLAAPLRPGTLIVADLGYFAFEWFDDLTDAGHFWISRARGKTSQTVVHVLYQDETVCDALVWIGAHRADRTKHLARRVEIKQGAQVRSYFTNVCDPALLSIGELARIYARRWDIEMGINLVKTDLNLHLLWSAKPGVIEHQIWGALLVAQVLQAMRAIIAARAGVDLFEVSMNLMIRYLPEYMARFEDGIGQYIADGVRMHFIRASRRVEIVVPDIPLDQITPPPETMLRTRTPRYGHRKCGPRAKNK